MVTDHVTGFLSLYIGFRTRERARIIHREKGRELRYEFRCSACVERSDSFGPRLLGAADGLSFEASDEFSSHKKAQFVRCSIRVIILFQSKMVLHEELQEGNMKLGIHFGIDTELQPTVDVKGAKVGNNHGNNVRQTELAWARRHASRRKASQSY